MRSAAVILVTLAFAPAAVAYAECPACTCRCETVDIAGPSGEDRAELSGLALIGGPNKFMAISNSPLGDDGRDAMLQIYEGDPSKGYQWKKDVLLFRPQDGQCADADFEGLTAYGNLYFAITSHSRDRKKQDKKITYAKNRKRLTAAGLDDCDARHQVFRFRLNQADELADQPNIGDLMPLIAGDPSLAPYVALPSKENGVDIEGIAATDEYLFVGFKGPVFRENYVPILRLNHDFQPVPSAESGSPLLFVDLGGRGVRDMTAGPGGIYILAGPNGNEDQSFAIYFWDGEDQIGGTDHQVRDPDRRCELGHFASGKPEGIAYIGPGDGGERFLLVYDGKKLQAETVVLAPAN
jgi:hypothetical protein